MGRPFSGHPGNPLRSIADAQAASGAWLCSIDVCKTLKNKDQVAHYDMRFVKPLDETLLHDIFQKFDTVITIEDGVIAGGFGSAILEFSQRHNYKKTIKCLGIPDVFIDHGSTEKLFKSIALDHESMKQLLESFC